MQFFLITTSIDISEPLIKPNNGLAFKSGNAAEYDSFSADSCLLSLVCYSNFKWKPKYLVHLLPFLIVNIALDPRFYSVDLASKLDFIINLQDMVELQFTHWLFQFPSVLTFFYLVVILKNVFKFFRLPILFRLDQNRDFGIATFYHLLVSVQRTE